MEYKGTTDKSTPIDLTNHTYFNLNGNESGLKIDNHEVRIFADNYLVSNEDYFIFTGETKSVENTKFDFRNFIKLSDRIKVNEISSGYNCYYIVNQPCGNKYSARFYKIKPPRIVSYCILKFLVSEILKME